MIDFEHLIHVFVIHDSILVLEVVPHGEHDVVLTNVGHKHLQNNHHLFYLVFEIPKMVVDVIFKLCHLCINIPALEAELRTQGEDFHSDL